MPLIDDEPPSSLPRGIGMRRWPVPASGSEEYSQFAAGFAISLAKPTGIRDQGWLSRPASSTSTLCLGLALKPVGEHRAGRAGAHHDVVKGLGFHFSRFPGGSSGNTAFSLRLKPLAATGLRVANCRKPAWSAVAPVRSRLAHFSYP